jgi:RNA polymerase sigma-70 factor (ECF subfamily)
VCRVHRARPGADRSFATGRCARLKRPKGTRLPSFWRAEHITANSRGPGRDTEVRDLVQQIQSGFESGEAFARLIGRYHKRVLQFFRRSGWSDPDAEELTQETFLRVYKTIGSFRADSRFETWLFAISSNVRRNAMRNLRSAKRYGLVMSLEEPAGMHDHLATPAPNALSASLERERVQTLRAALDSLPGQMRRVVLLRLSTGLKYREIADLMKISIGTVKAHLHQAMARLKVLLAEDFSDFDL